MENNWKTGPDAWAEFVKQHPELGYKPGRMCFHNFLRLNRDKLKKQDAIRLAKNKFWIAHVQRFNQAAFAISTGVFRPDEPALNVSELNRIASEETISMNGGK